MNNEEVAAAVDELDTRLERLRVLMEQYFQGIEKIPPFIVQKDVDRRIWVLRREKIRNTGTRFRFQQIIQRYNTFNSYWTRILREIENGTYKRHVARARKRFGIEPDKPQVAEVAQPQSEPPPASVDLDMHDLEDDDDLSDLGDLGPLPTGKPAPVQPVVAAKPAPVLPPSPSKAPLQRPPPSPSVPRILASKVENDDDLDDMLDAALGTAPAKPKPPPVVAKPEPKPAPRPAPEPPKPEPPKPAMRPAPQQPSPFARPEPAPSRPGDDPYRRVYAQYVEARRKNGESTAGLTYENLAKSLQATTEKLKPKSGGKAIDFEVATKDGKTILKPVVR